MSSYLHRRPDVSGIAITIAVHAGIGAALLLLVDQVVHPAPPPRPIVIQDVFDPPPPQPLPTRPPSRDLPVRPEVVAPTWDIEPTRDPGFATALDGTGATAGPGDGVTATQPPVEPVVPGPSQPARFVRGGASQPSYPTASRRLGEEGAVVVRVSIDAEGRVVAAELVGSSGFPRLDAAALEHARRRWRFEPALQDGRAMASTRTITVSFRLADG